MRGRVAILATAYSIDDFDSYQLSAQPADQSSAPVLLAQGTLPQQMRVLGEWDTLASVDETNMRLHLRARDRSGNEAVSEVVVVVDNSPPAAPQQLIATLDNDDAQVSWNPNSEADLLAQLRPNIDGLVLEETATRQRGTFLPAVWETLPDPATFLAHLKQKAGLPRDYWSDALRVSRYTTVNVG